MALTLLFINAEVNQPLNLTPVLAPLNYVSILAPAQIHPKANSNRLLLQPINLLTNQPLNSSSRYTPRIHAALEQAVNKQSEISAASSIPIFLSGCIEKGLLKLISLLISILVLHNFISIRPKFSQHSNWLYIQLVNQPALSPPTTQQR